MASGVTPKGYATAGAPTADPTDVTSALDMRCQRLRPGEALMLRTIVETSAAGITRADLAATAGRELSGGTFSTYLRALLKNGLIKQRGDVPVAIDVLGGTP